MRWQAFNQTTNIPALAGQVWAVVSDFAGANKWLDVPVTMQTAGDARAPGAVRYVHTAAGRWAYEKLLKLDDERREMAYTALDNNLHLVDYVSEISVAQGVDPGTCTLTWLASTSPSQGSTEELFRQLVTGVYSRGVVRLLQMVRPGGGEQQQQQVEAAGGAAAPIPTA